MAAAAGRALRLGSQLKEIRLHLCQTSGTSKGVREFIEQHYVNIKKENPNFPILIRECSGIEPKLWARYGRGKEASYTLSNLSSEAIIGLFHTVASVQPKAS